jgi:hypothetical protein
MATPRQAQSEEGSLGRDLLYALRYYLGSRRGLLVLAGLAIAAGLALNWSWLAAAGIAPILISVLPCVAMCALGLCMNRSAGKSCSTAANKSDPAAIEDAGPVTQAVAPEALPDRAAPVAQISSDAAVLANPEPRLAREKRPTDA